MKFTDEFRNFSVEVFSRISTAVDLSEKETEAAVGERLERFERFEVALVFLLQCNSYWTTLYRRHSCRQTCHGTLVLQCTLEVYPNGDVDAVSTFGVALEYNGCLKSHLSASNSVTCTLDVFLINIHCQVSVIALSKHFIKPSHTV